MKSLRFRSIALSDTGTVRTSNEDAWLVSADGRLLAVADGMGGHRAGEVAAALCIELLDELFEDAEGPRPWWRFWGPGLTGQARLVDALKRINRAIFDASRARAEYQGMGTTVVVLWLDGGQLHYAHLGDSRLYRLRGDALDQLTRDHSLLNRFEEAGLVEAGDRRQFPYKNVIMRALGLQPVATIDAVSTEVRPGERFLLCSDGLTDLVDATTIRERLSADSLEEGARGLIRAALEAGGVDNVTVVVAHLEETE